jgi:signal transduction histidine kinase
MEQVDLRQIAEAAIIEFDGLSREKRVKMVCQAKGAHSGWCDALRIGQVFRNLLANALKFSHEGTTVRVRFALEHLPVGRRRTDTVEVAAWRITVSDEGIGVPPNELEMVFEKFVQASGSKAGSGGTGLGLSICREIIRAHGGRIWVENNSAAGASFHFVVPQTQSALAAALEELGIKEVA